MLELARVGASVDRRRYHQQVGALDGAQFMLDGLRQLLARESAAYGTGDVAQFDDACLDGQ
ncbi:hypothetical protein D3C72_2160420 [compost metagenome]